MRGEQVDAVEPEREVEHVVVGDRHAVVLLERLGRDDPVLGDDAAGDQQRHDLVVGRLADLVVQVSQRNA